MTAFCFGKLCITSQIKDRPLFEKLYTGDLERGDGIIVLMINFLKSRKYFVAGVIVFLVLFVAGYISGTLVSYEGKWFGAGPTFFDALKPF